MKELHVPLAIDAQVRIPFGPVLLPLRTLLVLTALIPFGVGLLAMDGVTTSLKLSLLTSLLVLGFAVGSPEREGLWIITWLVYRLARRGLPTVVASGVHRSARVRAVGEATEIAKVRSPLLSHQLVRALVRMTEQPTLRESGDGIISLDPGGSRAVLLVQPPAVGVDSDAYATWCVQVVTWLSSLQCAAQFHTVVDHCDGMRARLAFEERTEHWPATPLWQLERQMATHAAEQSLATRHAVVLLPGVAGADGIPSLSRLSRMRKAVAATREDTMRAAERAMRLAASSAIAARPANAEDLEPFVTGGLLGATDAAVDQNGILTAAQQRTAVLTVLKLPARIHAGVLVEALMRANTRCSASLYFCPVEPAVARRTLGKRASLHKYALREGAGDVENAVALHETSDVLAALARRQLEPCRLAVTIAISNRTREGVLAAAEKVSGSLASDGFDVTRVSSPGFLPFVAATPGATPMNRSLQLTSRDAAACLLPALGTPFSEHTHPLVGVSEATAGPVYHSVWSCANHNAMILGTSGAGKSVAAKTLLIRHLMDGGSAVIIDPDSEYRRVMNAVGGAHLELGEDSLNPLGTAAQSPPDVAAGLVLPVLSVMAGDEKGVRDGRPIRRLVDEDQCWLYEEVASFYRCWDERRSQRAAVMSDLVEFLERDSIHRALTVREQERCRVITARLRRYIQGSRALVFDRASTFRVDRTPISIGLRTLAMSYAADLTAALAVVLTELLAALTQGLSRLLVVVDEAHRVTVDPDAGHVLAQLVRQARKHGAGVWMCSQRVDDFIGNDLGRTLAATAATKLLLGCEESSLGSLKQVFGLAEDEVSALNPAVQGRGVLIAGDQRTVVRILPGPAILAIAQTSPALAHGASAAVA